MADVKLNIVTMTNLEGLNKLKSKLEEVKKVAQSADEGGFFNLSAQEINQTVSAVNTLQYALKAAYDTKLNTVNIEKFNKILAKNNMTVKDLYHNLSKAGVVGQQAFMDMTQSTLMMGRSVKQTSKFVEEMQTTMMNTVKWGISSGLWNIMLSSVSKAWGYVKGLNADLTDIRIVTGKSADQMERFAKTANKAAKDLGVATRDYTQGALLYYQQGDDDETVKTKTDITAKASNITGQDMSTVSEQLTAVWNGYQVANQAAEEGMQVYEEYVDKLSAVAASTASDLEEQATAMSKVASAAYSMGVNFDDLNAQIATIVSVTRQAPESVGTALKTIYARLGDLKVDGVDEFGTKLGEVSGQLQTMGIEVLDSNGDMREMSTVMTEVAEKWNTWTSAQKQAAAVAMAGKRQYNNLIALFDNWDMYGESLETSMEAAGTLSEQQGIAMDSLEKKMQRMTTASEKMYDALFDDEAMGGLVDALTVVVDLIGSAVEGVGGLSTILPAVGGMMLKSFGGKIANSITTKIENRNTRNAELDNHKAKLNLANQLGKEGAFLNKDGSKDSLIENELKANVGFYKDMYKYRKQMTDEELAATNELTKRRAALSNEKIQVKENLELAREKNVISKDEYKTLIKINEAGIDGQKKLQELKEKNEKRQHTLERMTEEVAFEQTEIADYDDQEASRDQVVNYKKGLKDIAQNNIANFFGAIEKNKRPTQEQQLNISNTLRLAAEEGVELEKIIERVNERLKEAGQQEIVDENTIEGIKNIYNLMDEKTKTFINGLERDFDNVIGQQLKATLGPDSSETIDALKTRVIELQKNGMTMKQALIKAMDDLRQESSDLAEDLEKIDINIIKEEDIKAEMEAAKKAQELKKSFQGITTAVGGFVQAGSGLSAVFNSFNSAMDPTLDSTERLKAAFMGLITAAPVLVNGITSIVNGYKTLDAAGGLSTVIKTLFTKATKDSTKALQEESAALEKSGDEHQEHAGDVIIDATAQQTADRMISNGAQNASSSIASVGTSASSTTGTLAGMGTTAGTTSGAMAGMGTTAGGAGGAIAGLGTAAVVAAAALVAVAAVVATVVIAINEHQTALEEATYRSREYEKATKEVAEEAKKEKEAIDNIVTSYKDLTKECDKSGYLTDELRVKTADLCIQYGQQDLALQALIASYEELNNIMDEAQSKANDDYIKKTGIAIDATQARIVNEIAEKGAGWMTDTDSKGKATLDVIDGQWADSGEEELHKILESYGVNVSDGHIYTADLVEALTENYDAIVKEIGEVNGDAAEELLKTINIVSDDLKEIKDMQNQVIETEKSKIAQEYQNKDYNSYTEYKQAIQEMSDKVADYFDSEQEAKEWASTQLTNQDNFKYNVVYDLAQTAGKKQFYSNNKKEKIKNEFEAENDYWSYHVDYYEALENKYKETVQNIEQDLNNLSEEELSFAFQYFDMKQVDESFTEFANKYSNFIDYLEKENKITPTIEFILDSNAEQITQEQIDSLFSNDVFSKEIKMSKEEFTDLDIGQQKILMSKYYLDYQNYLSQNKDAIVNEVQGTVDELNNMDIDFNGYNKSWIQSIGNAESLESIYDKEFALLKTALEGRSTEDIVELIRKRYEGTLTEAETAELAKAENFLRIIAVPESDNLLANDDLLNDIGLAVTLNGQYQAALDKATVALKEAKASEADYATALKHTRDVYPAINEGIDNLQEGYSTLTSIVEDYNDNGTLSLDSVQTLLTMSEEMLACLEVENGQMKINNDKIKEMALARLDEAKATVMMETQTGLLDILNKKVAESENQATYQAILRTEAVTKGAEAAKASADEWLRYNAIVGEVDLSEIYNSQEAQDFLENQRKKMLGLESAAEGLKNMDMTIISGDERDEELKKLEDEFDRYWDLNNIIEKTAKSLEDLSETQDKLTRGELQDSLREQNELLEQQIVNYQNLRKEQEKEAGELKGKLLTFGVDFNADGSIANYAEVTQKALNYYNDVAQRYNKGIVSDKGLEKAEKSYEKFKEALERYDSLYYDEMVETAENIADTQREILENNLQDFELSITIKTDAAEFNREVKDFKTEIAKDFTKAFEDIDSVIEKSQFNVESYGESFNAVAAGISKVEEEILKLHNGENSDMFSSITEAQEKLKELNKEAMEHASNMKAAYEEAWEVYLEGIDQSQEKFDDLQEKYSKINEELEYQKELIELIYGPKAYDLMDKFYEKQKENSLSQIKSLQYEKELWLSKYDAEAAQAGDEDQLKIAERISQIQSDLNSNVTSYIQLLKDEYANTISGILSNFESQLTNGSSFDDIAEEWERLTENSDKYFNNVEGLYETQTLANKIKDSINDTISIKNQEKLQALYNKEIEYLREKENLTQYDLDAAEARYQIALKEIALEEARVNKNSMRLTRDVSGNWSYQYVADENNIAEKQQELFDAMYKFYELSDKAYKENLESIQKLNQEYFDKAEEIATNELLTEQEKELKLEELRKWYLNQYQLLVSENEIIRQNLANGTVGVLNNLYNQDVENFKNMTLQEQDALTQVKELGIASFAELEDKARQNIEGIGNSINIVAEQNIPEMTSKTQELANTWGADDGASVKAQSLDAFNSMMETSKQYQITLSKVAAAVKEDWGENGIAGAISNATQHVIDLEEATKNLCNDTKTNLATYKDNVNKISTSWGNVKTAIEDSIKQLNELYKLQGNPPPKATIPGGTAVQGGGGGFADVSNNVGGGKKSGNPPNDNSSIVGYLFGADLQASQGGNRKYDLDDGKEYSVKAYDYVDYGKAYAPYPIRVKLADDREGYVAPGSLYSLRWGKNGVPYRDKLINTFGKVGSFDTGGYTGEWGSDGRIAMLHEKELVLNKEDTSNILAAVNGIRQFSSIENAISKGIASMIMNMTGMGVNVNYNTNEAKGNQTKQVFNIQAEFPNANNVSEIREAILSLPGLASQQVGLNLI